MQVTFGIDVSKSTSTVCELIGESKKLSSQTKGFKKIAIASIHKLIRTIYALIINDQLYDYNIATHNQKDFSRN